MENETRLTDSITVLNFVNKRGLLQLRSKMKAADSIPANDPLRLRASAAAERLLQNLAVMAIAESIAEQEEREREAVRATARRKNEIAAVHEKWNAVNPGDLAGLLVLFDGLAPGELVCVNSAGGTVAHPGGSENAWNQVLKMPGHKLALRVKQDAVGVCVRAESAAAFEKRYDLPRTLCWRVGDFTCWLFGSGGTAVSSLKGKSVIICTREPLAAERHRLPNDPPFLPLSLDARWVIGPGRALPKDSDVLPGVPDALLKDFRNLSGVSSAELIDRILLAA